MPWPATGYEPAPALRPKEFARWTWRQLTSMRTALILLFLLALAAIPGSVVPQEAVDSVRASQWRDQHPQLTPIYEKLGLFSVYDSVWFSAIYILLMISLVGCIVPRLFVYWRGVRAQPPKAPKNLSRLPEHRELDGGRHHSRDRGGVAEAEALPGGGRGRRGARRARLPARGRQPAVPPLGADRAGRLRGRRAVRLQGRRHRGDQGRLRQHPEPVRRLPGRRAASTPTT